MAFRDFFCSEQAFWRSKTDRSKANQIVKIILLVSTLIELVNTNAYFWLDIYRQNKDLFALLFSLTVFINLFSLFIAYLTLIVENQSCLTLVAGLSFFSIFYHVYLLIQWQSLWLGLTQIFILFDTILFVCFALCVLQTPPTANARFDV